MNTSDHKPSHVDARLLTPEQAGAALNVGRTRLYELLASGALQSVTIGRSRRVPVSAVDEYVELLCSTIRPNR